MFVGDAQREEFREAWACLDAVAHVRRAADIEAALGILSDGFLPSVIVIAQAFPDQFSLQSVDCLQRAAPLARLLGLLGSWCEGEARTGHPWPGVMRLYWHQFPAQCAREFDRLRSGGGSAWGLPTTAGDEERLLADQDTVAGEDHGLIVIWSRQYAMQDWLSSACRLRGCSTVWLSPERTVKLSGAVAAVFDGCCCDEVEVAELAKLGKLLRSTPGKPAPVIALLDFPRIEDHARAVAAGASAVLSKPLAINDLFWQLDRLLSADGRNRLG